MRQTRNFLAVISLYIFFSSACLAATLTGTVKGPDGAPFEGAFVQAQNAKTRMSFIVLSDSQGRYRVEKLPAGEYRVTSRATGFRQDTAIVAARQKFVEGAVGMVEMALEKLSERKLVTLDEERKAAMVSNLLVVLCSDQHTQPVVNTGTLYQ